MENTTPPSSVPGPNPFLIPIAIIVAGLIIAAAIFATGQLTSSKDQNKEIKKIEVSADDDPVLGLANAPITMIEFSDFQCPYCKSFFEETFPEIKSKYIDTGKVRFVYRDFIISSHAYAQKAAEAAECADDQGKFWEMQASIFKNQKNIKESDLKSYAATLNLDRSRFNNCLDSGKYKEEVLKDISDGQAAGIKATPTFVINGVLVEGAYPFETFKEIFEDLLSK